MALNPMPRSCGQWHTSAVASGLMAELGPFDVRLVLQRGCPGADTLEWHPDSNHGAAIFESLAVLRQQAVGQAFTMASDDGARAVALAAAQCAPTVSGALAGRFADPARWLGYGAVEATRRFRANWS